MAVTTTIPIGRPHTMVTNEEYALPGRKVTIHVTGLGAGAIEVSDNKSTWVAVTLDDDENFECVATWIRCTTAADACIITAK